MMPREKSVLWALAITGVLYLSFCLPLLPVASDDFRLVNVFSIDESDIVTHVWNLYVSGGTRAPSFKYGGVFYYFPTLILYVWSMFGSVTEQVTIVVVRFFCVVSGLGCLWTTYALGREVFDEQAGAIAAFVLMVGATFLRWSVESHPDLPQLLFILLALIFACRAVRDFELRRIVIAAAFAGLAFGTKYGGIFLLPILVIASVFPEKQAPFWSGLRMKQRWLAVGAVPVVFTLVFCVTNPMAVMQPAEFYTELASEKEIMGFGHRVAATSELWTWVLSLFSLTGVLHCLVLAAGAVVLIAGRQWSAIRSDRMVLVLWIALFLGYLMAESQLKRARHLLPVLPCMLVFVGAAYGVVWEKIHVRMRRLAWGGLLAGAMLSWGHLQASVSLFAERHGREEGRTEIIVGRWLGETFDKETSILFDVYAYVPTKFQNVFRSIGMSYAIVNHYEPELLVIRDAVMSDYADPNEAQQARQGLVWYMDRHYFYEYLQRVLIPAYQLMRDFGSVAVYKRVLPIVRADVDERKRWRHLIRQDLNRNHYGLVAAHWTMGFLHQQQGKTSEAEAAFERAQKNSKFAKRLYSHGALMLSAGQPALARHAFDAALKASEEESVLYRAGMREDLAFRYFKARLFEDMLHTAQDALMLTDDLPAATFEHAVAQLALQNKTQGIALFEAGIARFGAHEKGERLLNTMVAMRIQADVAQDLIRRYYGAAR